MGIASESDLTLRGETVTISYTGDPAVGHGQFRLANHGSKAVTLAVAAAGLTLGDSRQPLTGVSVFNVGQEKMVDPQGFRLEAGETVTLLLGFPVVAYAPGFGDAGAVDLRLSAEGDELSATSPLRFERRIPRG